LEPGEKRTRADLEARNLQAIQNKIAELIVSLDKSSNLANMFKQDAALQASLENLRKRLDLKIDYLNRMKTRHIRSGKIDKMFDILDRECSDFLHVMKFTGKLVYRGLRTNVSVFEGRSREDRVPKDSNLATSNRLDQALRNHGFKALRSNSIFTTTDRSFAIGYGNIYCIFPKNGFHVLTTNERDLIINSVDSIVGHDWKLNFTNSLKTWLMDNVPEWLGTPLGKEISGYYYDDVLREIKNNFNDGNPLKLPDEFNKTKEDLTSDEAIMNYLDPRSDDLENAMIDGREILINGEYWALSLDQWRQYIIDSYLEGTDPHPG